MKNPITTAVGVLGTCAAAIWPKFTDIIALVTATLIGLFAKDSNKK